MESSAEWRKFCKGEYHQLPHKPTDIPVAVDSYYKNDGWSGFPDFLGSEYIYENKKHDLNTAKRLISELKISSMSEYNKFRKNGSRKDSKLFKTISAYTKDPKWKGLEDFLNTHTKNTTKIRESYLNYQGCKKVVQSLYPSVSSYGDWQELLKKYPRDVWPVEIPRDPKNAYNNKGWKGWADFLGKVEKK